MMCDIGMCTSGQKSIKTRIKTPICLNSKGNEIIAWCLFSVWLCLFLNNHHHYMCYYYRCSLHHICASQVNNDDVYQGSKVISSDKDIHLLSSVVKEKVGDLPLNMCSTLQNNNCDSILKYIVGCYMVILARIPKQMGT
jgi:hypothetical protein